MSVKISTFQWHEFFPRGSKLELFAFLLLYFFFQNEFIGFVLCSAKKSWCCSCTLVSNYSGMCLQVPDLVSVQNFNICHAVIQLLFSFLGILYGYSDLVCHILYVIWWYLWGIPSTWRGQSALYKSFS